MVDSVTDAFELLDRLRTFGAYVMDDDGNLTGFQANALTSAAADEIQRLQHRVDHLNAVLDDIAKLTTDAGLVDRIKKARRG